MEIEAAGFGTLHCQTNMEQRPTSKSNSSMEKEKLELIRDAWSGVIGKSE